MWEMLILIKLQTVLSQLKLNYFLVLILLLKLSIYGIGKRSTCFSNFMSLTICTCILCYTSLLIFRFASRKQEEEEQQEQ